MSVNKELIKKLDVAFNEEPMLYELVPVVLDEFSSKKTKFLAKKHMGALRDIYIDMIKAIHVFDNDDEDFNILKEIGISEEFRKWFLIQGIKYADGIQDIILCITDPLDWQNIDFTYMMREEPMLQAEIYLNNRQTYVVQANRTSWLKLIRAIARGLKERLPAAPLSESEQKIFLYTLDAINSISKDEDNEQNSEKG